MLHAPLSKHERRGAGGCDCVECRQENARTTRRLAFATAFAGFSTSTQLCELKVSSKLTVTLQQ